MFWDYVESIVQLLSIMLALLICLFRFIGNSRRSWLLAILLFLSDFVSCYFWTSYLLIMGDWPDVSDAMTYFGWNTSFFILLVLLIHTKSRAERRYFHAAMLLPVPLNIWQLTLYNSYGSKLNNYYQVAVCTAIACMSIQGFCWYLKRRRDGAAKPWVSLAAFIFAATEFAMWTSTCYDAPVSDLYYLFSLLNSADLFFLIWAISRSDLEEARPSLRQFDRKYQRILKASYIIVCLSCSVGGVLLALWIRDTIAVRVGSAADIQVYEIISWVLFVISLIITAFAIAVILVAYFAHRAVENNSLREAKRIAEQASEAKSEFLANMSHEIRTPINAVMGMNEMIMRESLQAKETPPSGTAESEKIFTEICGYAGNIESAGRNLLSIINDILDISKIEAGKLEIREDHYRLSSVLNDAANLILFKARAKGLAFEADVDPQLPDELYGDELRVRQIITNLLNNAVKYTRSGSVALIVRGETADGGTDGKTVRLSITVKDTGIGIREEDIGKLFNKFERIDLKRNNSIEGSGLGLAICRSLLDMMGGSISVESEYGKGSAFTAVIPQKVDSDEPIGDLRGRLRQGEADSRGHRNIFRAPDARVLAVDDTQINITVLEGLLKHTGIRIDTVNSGEEALALCRGVRYDLILMDQRMPDMDGTETLHRIREAEDGLNRETPVICLTADAVTGARQRYLAEGYTDYLTKPVNGSELEEMLIRHLPAEKVQMIRRDTPDRLAVQRAGIPGIPEKELRRIGVRPETGMRYCRNDGELYRSILVQFATDEPEAAEKMQAFFEARDWHNYAIVVHALKGTARMIGATELGEQAAALETAAKDRNAAKVEEGHAKTLSRYRRLAEAIRRLTVPENEPPAPDTGEQIMEFYPENE